ncbi:MAG: DUF1284 domain-containing protein [Chloroflexi bacterium]|nr:DUF1284 domain-containing protein [Chloroflexota bacterium]
MINIQLRPHHLCCSNFLGMFDPARSNDYKKVKQIIENFWNQELGEIELKEGPDMLCVVCTYFNGNSCVHPKGNEKAVIKWDQVIMNGLDLSYGQCIEIKKLKTLIINKIPMDFCLSKCQYHKENKCNPHILPDCLKLRRKSKVYGEDANYDG